MKRYIKLGVGGFLLISFMFISASNEVPTFIEMEVKGVRIDAIGQNPVVILIDKEGKIALPIWIGVLEAGAIDRELKKIHPPRPMTHDLLHSILAQLKAKVKEVKIIELKDHTYFATLSLKLNKDVIEIDARPSDAIILALKSKSPIFVSAKILDQQGIILSKKEEFAERYGIRVQELTPSLASHFNFKGQKGVLISEVISGSPAETSGLKAGDIITKINYKEVGTVQEFGEIFDKLQHETSIKIQIFRDEKFKEFNLFLKPE
jgi:bifunctional DNase/RNase